MSANFVRKTWAWIAGRRAAWPEKIGNRPHDCALASLYWAVPWLPESRIVEAFNFCTDAWPHGGVTNQEFSVALKYLDVEYDYSDTTETLGEVLHRKPKKAVALLHGHFIAIHKGRIIGYDAIRHWPNGTTVYCCWTFSPTKVSTGVNVASYRLEYDRKLLSFEIRWLKSIEKQTAVASKTMAA